MHSIRALLLVRHYSNLAIPSKSITAPFGESKFEWGDFVDYQEFDGGRSMGMVVRGVMRGTIEVFFGNKTQFRHIKPAFVRFVAPRTFPKDRAKEGLEQMAITEALRRFEEQAQEILSEHTVDFERYIRKMERLAGQEEGRVGASADLIYEADMAEALFGQDKVTYEQVFAIHLFLHSSPSIFRRDLLFQIGIRSRGDQRARVVGGGPYMVRGREERETVRLVQGLLERNDVSVGEFRTLINLTMTGEGIKRKTKESDKTRMIRVHEERFKPFIDFFKLIAYDSSWQENLLSSYLKLAQSLLLGVFNCGTANDALLLLSKLDPIHHPGNLDLPLRQSALWRGEEVWERSDAKSKEEKHQQPTTKSTIENLPDDLQDRVDFGTTLALAIDSTQTVEVDDAISVEQIGSQLWLHVHIADVSRLLPSGSSLDMVAQQRASTLYLPMGFSPMLPLWCAMKAGLSEVSPSSAESPTLAMTFSARLDSQGDIADYRITRGVLRNLRRITYQQADTLLKDQSSLSDLQAKELLRQVEKLAVQHLAYRRGRGHLSFSLPQPKVMVQRREMNELDIAVTLDDGNSPSQQLVAEAMIIAGRVAALYSHQHNLPIPYRYHLEPSLQTFKEGTEGVEFLRKEEDQHYRLDQLFRRAKGGESDKLSLYERIQLIQTLRPSALHLLPRPHWAMGLDMYCKATSPLRRYFDLLLHQQLTRSLKGQTPLTVEHLAAIIPPVYRHEQYRRRLERASLRYWILRRMEQIHIGSIQPNGDSKVALLQALLLDYSPLSNAHPVYLPQFAITLYATIYGASTLKVGEMHLLALVHVDPRRQTIQLALNQ